MTGLPVARQCGGRDLAALTAHPRAPSPNQGPVVLDRRFSSEFMIYGWKVRRPPWAAACSAGAGSGAGSRSHLRLTQWSK